jgi:RNA polymerase sigma-70 factor (ECF subfamily)
MADHVDATFIQQINQNLGSAHKVVRIYFPTGDDRDDVLQEMMYQLWRSYPRFDKRAKFSTWMYSVCLNTALTYKRKSRNEHLEPLSPTHHQVEDQSSSDEEESVNLLFDAIAKLSPLNKAIILLYLEDMSYEEIAALIGLTKSNVSVRLVRIKRELETQLKRMN